MRRILVIPLILTVWSGDISAQKKSYTAVRLNDERIVIDGVPDDEAWSAVEWEGDFIQLRPYENRKPSQQTTFKILYDDNYIYALIRAYDSSPDSIVRRMTRRDEGEGDLLGIGFDSYHDLRTAFVFLINAAGVKSDAVVTEDNGNWDYSWDPIWYVKTSIDDKGWIAEMKIPLTQLRFGKKENYIWGLQVGRVVFRKDEESGWCLIPLNAPGWVSYFGELYGIKGIKPRKQKDIIPYMVASVERYEKSDEDPFLTGKGSKISGGLDAKFGLTNDFTMDLSINPDFGQVEADPSVVNLTAFETYYEEKRPFFIEGRNIMNFSLTSGGPLSSDNLFYSRRIGRPPQLYPDTDDDDEYVKSPSNTTILGAFKITGKTRNGWSLGVLESITQREITEIDSSGYRRTEPVEPLTNYSLVRLQKDLNEGNTRIGGMLTATNRQLDNPVLRKLHSSAYTGGFDFNHQWKDKTYYFTLQTIFSHVSGTKEALVETQTSAPYYFQRPDAPHLKVDSNLTSLTGFGGTITGGRAGNSKWPFLVWITWRSPSLELNDIGYLYNPDIIQQIFWAGYQNYEPFSIFRVLLLNFNQWYGCTFGIEKLYFGGNFEFNANFKNYWYTTIGFSYDTRNASPVELRGGPMLFFSPVINLYYNFSTDSRKKLVLSAGVNHNIGTEHQFHYMIMNAGISWRINKAIKIDLSPNVVYFKNNIAYVENVEDSLMMQHYIRGTLNQIETSLTIRLTYNITPDFTIQYYGMPFVSAGDYNQYKYISDPSAGRFSDRFIPLLPEQIYPVYDGDDLTYSIHLNGDGTEDYSFGNPDFNSFQYRSNLVARWEYLSGSTVYLVWSFTQNRYKNEGNYSFEDDMGEIFRVHPHNVFLIKFSYRFGL
jgi:hypothetical protein